MLPAIQLFQGCSGLIRGTVPRLVAIQTARVPQIEFYKQWYDFNNADQALAVLKKIVGSENWKVYNEHLLIGSVIEDFLNKKIEVQGCLIFTISLVPTNQDSFFVEGMGRYYVVRKTTNEIILSADYHIKNNRYALRDLETGILAIDFDQYVIQHFAPDKLSYYYDASLSFRIRLNTALAYKSIYSIDYGSKHELVFNKQTIGYLEFDKSTPSKDKIIDLRSIDLIVNDYEKIMKEGKKRKERSGNK
jgi:hypothetical protein